MVKGKKTRRAKKNAIESSCPYCDEPDEGDMILCDWCDNWYHFSCVKVKKAPKSQLWKCPDCKKNSQPAKSRKEPPENPTEDRLEPAVQQERQPVGQGAVKKNPNRPIKSLNANSTPIYTQGASAQELDSTQASVVSISSDWRIQLELQRVEEEKRFSQRMQDEKYQLQQRYLDKKYEILMRESCGGSLKVPSKVASVETSVNKSVAATVKNIVDPVDNVDIDMNDFLRRLEALKRPTAATEQRRPLGNQLPTVESNINDELESQSIETKPRNKMTSSHWKNIQLGWSKDTEKSNSSLHLSYDNSKSNERQSHVQQPKVIASDNWNVPVPGSVTLTRAQIAARQVVTKDLPIFNGKPEDWSLFYKRFVNSTELCGYSDGENLDRLQKCLKKPASDAVRDLLLDVDAVKDIIDTLRMLFGRPELIVKSLLKQIREYPIPKAENLSSIVTFALNVRNLAKTIERREMSQYLNNPILLQELVDRLPTIHKVDWARSITNIPDDKITLITLSDWLQGLMKDLIKVTEFLPKESEKANEKKSNRSSSERINVHHMEKEKAGEKFINSENHRDKGNKCIICRKLCTSVPDCGVFKSLKPAQRWKAIYDNKLCRKCLRRHGGFCRVNKDCGVNSCTFKHHSLLHDDEKHKPNQDNVQPIEVKTDVQSNHISFNSKVLLRIIPIKIFGNGISLDTFAFLDDGSTATLIDEKLADALQLVGVNKELCLIWSGNIHRRERNSRQVNVFISSLDNSRNQFKLREVKTVSHLGIPHQRLNKDELCKKFPYLQRIPFLNYENGVPGILIGSNNPRVSIPREVVDGNDFEPIAARTLIGWTVHGPTSESESSSLQMNHHRVEECKCKHEHDESLHQSMKDHFSIDNFGVQVPSTLAVGSKDDEKAMQQLANLTKRIDGRYETGLLWRYENFTLPESYWMARRRLECLERKKPETIKIIDDTIQDYVQKGYARKLTKEEAADHRERHWYLPVFTVTYPKKPDKHRMVFDAAAKVKGTSLNSMLLKGPDQLVSLVEILRRFREKLYALGGDIREMFPQVEIRKEDQQCQRFLWRNGDQTVEPDVYVMLVMTFGAACSPCSAHFVKNLNASDYAKDYPRAAEAIIKNHYMDDMMDGENSEEELIQLGKDVRRIHSQAGFEIRNFLSNSKKVMEQLGSTTETESKSINPDKEFDIERVLGMWWNVNTDSFTFSLKFLSITRDIFSGENLPTKRELLKLLMSIFDPLGLISHYLIHLKIIIQDVWRSQLDWDEPISSKDVIEPWKKWLEVLPTVDSIQIPRLLTPKLARTGTSIELHTFVDASEKAFGAVTYLRVEDEFGVDCAMIGSKSRVAPLKYLSIPRKELQGGLLGSRLAKSIAESQTFKVAKRVFWTDSTTLLSWLGSDQRKYHQFVAHRVGEILENTNLSEWRWVPAKLNVADDLTKWAKYSMFDKSNRWFNGPSFLKEHESNWPVRNENDIVETTEEMKVIYAHNEVIVNPFFDSKRFSNWNRMVRAVAYAIRFTKILRAKVKKELVPKSCLSRDELVHAQNIIYRQAQFEGFLEEMVILEINKTLPVKNRHQIPKSSSLISCSPYLDDAGVLRVRGRIDFGKNISTNTKRPIIMPRKNGITKLLVGEYHRIYHHRNHETAVNEIRQKFYVPKLRVVLKSIVTNDCQLCKNRRAKPQPPEEGNLPPGRMAIGFRPFTHTGIDYFGPMLIIQGRSEVKRWGVLFTCLTVRAIHIEIAYTLNTQSCIKCIRNFVNLRGQTNEFYSDCGTNLVGTNNELERAVKNIDVNQLASTFTNSYCKWNFNPPEAKHMGGAWERLVRSVKDCLYDIMPMRKPNDEMFRSLLMEIVNVVNSRPLTFIPLDNENDEALTPNHFIHLSSNGFKPPGDFASDGPFLRSEWKEIQRLTDCFWKRFVDEYVPTLTRKTKWFQPVAPLEIGDVVLVIDSKNDRNVYPKARVVDRIIGSNNQVRRARVQFANGSMLWRGSAGLARLDISSDSSSTVLPDSQTGGTVAKAK